MASPLNLFLSLPTCIYQEVLQLQLQHVLDTCTAWPRPSRPLICGPASLLLQPCLLQSGCIWAPYHVLPRLTTLQHLPLPSEWKPTLKSYKARHVCPLILGPCLPLLFLLLLPLGPFLELPRHCLLSGLPLTWAHCLTCFVSLLTAHLLSLPCPDHPVLQLRPPFCSTGAPWAPHCLTLLFFPPKNLTLPNRECSLRVFKRPLC